MNAPPKPIQRVRDPHYDSTSFVKDIALNFATICCKITLVRLQFDDPTEKTFYLVFGKPGATLVEMVQAIGARWSIETCFETSKERGIDNYEVRRFTAWYRFVTLVMVVMAALAGICVVTRASPPG